MIENGAARAPFNITPHTIHYSVGTSMLDIRPILHWMLASHICDLNITNYVI